MKSPIFLFSLPRSGSTLLQRILVTHNDIASTAEPWILLPLIFMTKKEGTLAIYSHDIAYQALQDFISNLPKKEELYRCELEKFVFNLYKSKCSNNEKYFLDKTPRYFLIIPDIYNLFPNAKFIFLFRNPASIYSSILKSWNNNSFYGTYINHISINEGFNYLISGYKLLQDNSILLRYEDFILDPKTKLKEIFSYLEIEYDKNCLKNFDHLNLEGRMGDNTGKVEYDSINKEPLEKWMTTFNNSFRKYILKKYLDNILDEYYDITNYNKSKILKSISATDLNIFKIFKDIIHFYKNRLVIKYNLKLHFAKSKKWAKDKFID